MSKELDKLIESALNEKLKLGITIPPEITQDFVRDVAKDYSDSSDPTKLANKRFHQQMRGLAQQSSPDSTFNQEDITRLLEKDKLYLRPVSEIISILKGKGFKRTADSTKFFAAAITKSLDAILRKDLKITKQDQAEAHQKFLDTKKYKNISPEARKSLAQQMIKFFKSANSPVPTDLEATLQQLIKGSAPVYNPMGASTDLPKLATDVTSEYFETNGVPKALRVRFDLVEAFSAIEPKGGMLDKLASVGKFLEAVEDPTKMEAWVKQNGDFQFMNYMTVVSILADMPKAQRALESGYGFERWLSLLLNIPVVGGEGAASDNMGKIVGGSPVFTSAKFMKSPADAMQSRDLINTFFEKYPDRDMFYFVMVKKGEKVGDMEKYYTNLDGLDFYLSRLYLPDPKKRPTKKTIAEKQNTQWENDEIGTIRRALINSNGQTVNDAKLGPGLKKYGKQESHYGIITSNENEDVSSFAFFSVQNLKVPNVDDRLLFSAAKTIEKTVKGKGFAEIAEKIMNSYKNLQAIEANTRGYSGKKGKKEEAQSYIKGVTSNFSDLKRNLNDVFKAGESDQQDRLAESRPDLNQLIEAIVKEKLLK